MRSHPKLTSPPHVIPANAGDLRLAGAACGVAPSATVIGPGPSTGVIVDDAVLTGFPAFAGNDAGGGGRVVHAPITISHPKPQPPQSLTAHLGPNRIRTPQTRCILPLIHPARREARRTLRGNGQVGVGVSCVDQADSRRSQLSCLAGPPINPAVPGARAFLYLKIQRDVRAPGPRLPTPTGGAMPMDASACLASTDVAS